MPFRVLPSRVRWRTMLIFLIPTLTATLLGLVMSAPYLYVRERAEVAVPKVARWDLRDGTGFPETGWAQGPGGQWMRLTRARTIELVGMDGAVRTYQPASISLLRRNGAVWQVVLMFTCASPAEAYSVTTALLADWAMKDRPSLDRWFAAEQKRGPLETPDEWKALPLEIQAGRTIQFINDEESGAWWVNLELRPGELPLGQ